MEVFGSGGGQRVAGSLSRALGTDVPLLGQVPLDVKVREGGDVGRPVMLSDPDSPASTALRGIARGLSRRRQSLVGKPLGLSPTAG